MILLVELWEASVHTDIQTELNTQQNYFTSKTDVQIQGRTFEKKLSAENLKYRLLRSMTNQALSVPGDWAPPSVSIFFPVHS